MYAKIADDKVTKFPYTPEDLRNENPNTSFPINLTDEIYISYNGHPVTVSALPEYDPLTQQIVTGSPVKSGDAWGVSHTVENLEQVVAEINIRSHRESLLSDTDWMASSDVTMSSAMTSYRQALRDIPAQEGFPFSITWPTKP